MTNKKLRELSKEEKTFSQKVIDGQEAEKKHLELMVEYNEFMLDKMLESNYLEKRRAFKRQTDDYKNELIEIQRTIDVTSKQMVEGVEIKEKVADTEETPAMVN